MEQRIDALEKRLAKFRGGGKAGDGDDDDASGSPESKESVSQEISNKILAFQTEIRRLEKVENL
jgi:hypothetical protein